MSIGLIGRKCGMSRVFTEDGVSIPVTVIEVLPNRVTRVKTTAVDGYRAVQITTGAVKASRINKAAVGEFRKAEVEAGRGLWEFRLDDDEGSELASGAEFTVDLLAGTKWVDVVGTTIGKGFAGGIKRHHFSHQRNSHGNSLSHRAPGSIGQNQTPGRVFPGKKMAGHLGDARRTIQNLEVVRVDAEKNLLLIKGGVPGAKGGDLVIRPAVKGAA
jgi:large subunit ribosomal protein L3